MMGIDHQHGRHRGHQPGADPGVSGRKRRSAVCRPAARGGVRLGRENARTAPVRELEQTGQGTGAAIHLSDDGIEPSAGHALDCAPTPHRTGKGSRLPADQVRQAVHGCRHRSACLRRQGARELKRTGDATDFRAGIQRLRAIGVCAAVVDLGGAPLSTAQHRGVPEAQHQLSTHAADVGSDRRTAQTATTWRARLSAHRYRPSGRSTGAQRLVSDQCRRRSDAVGDCGRDSTDLGVVADPRAGSDFATVPLRDSRVSFRQWQRVHQLHRGQIAGQTTHPADQVTRSSLRRQRPGGGQER